MSEAMKIGDALKAAQEVTALASTDRLLAFGQDGSLKKISQTLGNRKSVSATKGTWIRIGSTIQHTNSGFLLFSISQGWNNVNPGVALFSVFFGASDYGDTRLHGKIVRLGAANPDAFPKARFVTKTSGTGGVSYIDVLMNVDNLNQTVNIVSSVNFDVAVAASATVPEDYSVVEFDFTSAGNTVGGRVISFVSVVYSSAAKAGEGGLHERGYDTHQCGAQGDNDGCLRVQRQVGRLGFFHRYGNLLCHGSKMRFNAFEYKPLWRCPRDGSRRICRAGISVTSVLRKPHRRLLETDEKLVRMDSVGVLRQIGNPILTHGKEVVAA